jgi:hypothetical protein
MRTGPSTRTRRLSLSRIPPPALGNTGASGSVISEAARCEPSRSRSRGSRLTRRIPARVFERPTRRRAFARSMSRQRSPHASPARSPANIRTPTRGRRSLILDGGSLVYGIAEDPDGRPRLLAPIELKGAAERIDQVAQNSISGNPKLQFVHLRLAEDESRGYLLVVVAASPEAPHQVTVGDDRRFYGRSDIGNRRLSEEEIARLYERRSAQHRDRQSLLAECIASSPFGEPPEGELGFLQAFVRPAAPDDDLWEMALEARGDEQVLRPRARRGARGTSTSMSGSDGEAPSRRSRRANRWHSEGRSIPRSGAAPVFWPPCAARR